MTDFILPSLSTFAGRARIDWSKESNNIVQRGPLTGVTKTALRSLWHKCTLSYQGFQSGTADDAILQAFIAQLKGGANRIWVYDDGYRQRGAFSAPELLTNNDFSNGTTGWTANSATIAASNRVMRLKFSGAAGNPSFTQDPSPTQYAVYAGRVLVNKLASAAALTGGVYFNNGLFPGTISTPVSQGLSTVAATVIAGGGPVNGFYAIVFQSSGFVAGEYLDVSWTSMARCLLVENGVNALLRSDEFDNAAWTKSRATITANSGLSPDQSTTRDDLNEDNTSGQHYVSQAITVSSGALDYCYCVAVRSGGRTFFEIQMAESTGGHVLYQFFNLSTAAVGVTGGTTGANWTNRRAFTRDLGNGWVLCCLIGRKVSAGTTITGYLLSATADSGAADSYLGTSIGCFSLWRATLAQSSVPVRLTQTVAAATTGTAQTGGALYVKGGRTPSEGALAGALLRGDRVEVITGTNTSELKILSADLDLDAAGNGYLQFEEPIRTSPSDGAAIIVNRPMVKCYSASAPNWPTMPGLFRSYTFDLEEAL